MFESGCYSGGFQLVRLVIPNVVSNVVWNGARRAQSSLNVVWNVISNGGAGHEACWLPGTFLQARSEGAAFGLVPDYVPDDVGEGRGRWPPFQTALCKPRVFLIVISFRFERLHKSLRYHWRLFHWSAAAWLLSAAPGCGYSCEEQAE
jgi:hypothetical protein